MTRNGRSGTGGPALHTLAPAAREGLAQALALAHTPAGVQAARAAFTSGLDIAMAVGSACVLATAVGVAWKMPGSGPAQASSPDRPLAQSAAQGERPSHLR